MTDTQQNTFPLGTVRGPYNNQSPSSQLSNLYFMVRGPKGWRPVHGMQEGPTFKEAAGLALRFLLENTSQNKPLMTPQEITVDEQHPDKGLTKGRRYKVRGDVVSGLYIFNDHCLKRYLKDENGKVSQYCEYINKNVQEDEEL